MGKGCWLGLQFNHGAVQGKPILETLVFWIADYTGRFSDPDNHVLQGHAVWHLLTALCLLFLYSHYLQFA